MAQAPRRPGRRTLALGRREARRLEPEVVPYAEWQLELPFAQESANILGAAYDPATQRIYLTQDGGDRPGCCGYLPVVPVYEVNPGA